MDRLLSFPLCIFLVGFAIFPVTCGSLLADADEPLWPADQGGFVDPNKTIVAPKVSAKVSGKLVFPSPDGRYAISWPSGRQIYEPGFDVANHLVDLQTGKSIHTIADDEYTSDCEGRNHGGFNVLWRADSRAVVVRMEGKWGPRALWLLVLKEQGKVDAVELTALTKKELEAIMGKQAPELWKKANGFAHYPTCAFSADGKTLNLKAKGETNAREIPGYAHIIAELKGTFDIEKHTLAVNGGKVTKAEMVDFE